MSPIQQAVYSALEQEDSKSRAQISEETGKDYHTVNRALHYLVTTGRAELIKINGVAHYMAAEETVLPGETTVQRAIRVLPPLHSVWAVA